MDEVTSWLPPTLQGGLPFRRLLLFLSLHGATVFFLRWLAWQSHASTCIVKYCEIHTFGYSQQSLTCIASYVIENMIQHVAQLQAPKICSVYFLILNVIELRVLCHIYCSISSFGVAPSPVFHGAPKPQSTTSCQCFCHLLRTGSFSRVAVPSTPRSPNCCRCFFGQASCIMHYIIMLYVYIAACSMFPHFFNGTVLQVVWFITSLPGDFRRHTLLQLRLEIYRMNLRSCVKISILDIAKLWSFHFPFLSLLFSLKQRYV